MQFVHRLATLVKPAPSRRPLLERIFWRIWRPVDRLVQDVGRSLSFLILRVSAPHLSAGAALKLAAFLSWNFPLNGANRAAVRETFAVDSARALEIVKGHRLTPYRDYALVRRLITERDRLAEFPWREEHPEIVRELRESGRSYLIAMGHFSRLATIPLYFKATNPREVTGLTAPHPPRSWKPGSIWKRLLLGQSLDMIHVIRPDFQMVHPGSLAALKGIVRKLRSSGHVIITSADAHWTQTEDCHTRPFLGHPVKYFSHGAAWMARMAQCPIAVCMPYLDETGNAVLDWRLLIDPPAKDDEAADERITKQLLDEVEAAVFRHPEQYVLDLTAS